MVKINYNFNKLQGALNETGAELIFKYKFYNSNFSPTGKTIDFDTNGLINNKDNLEINYYGGLNFYKKFLVITAFGNLKTKKQNLEIHFSQCKRFLDNFKNNINELILLLPNSIYLKNEHSNKNFKKHYPCEDCLKIINWNNISTAEDWSKRIIMDQFKLENLYQYISPIEKELQANLLDDVFLKNLPINFTRVNEVVKAQKKWICEKCKINTSGMKKIFHLKLKKTNFNDINHNNFIGVCASCLKLDFNEIYLFPDEIDFIKKFKPKN